MDVLYPDIHSYEELEAAVYAVYDYYINEYPLHRYGGKTAGEVRKAALEVENPKQYPIPKNNRIIKYWDHIHSLQNNDYKKENQASFILAWLWQWFWMFRLST